MGNIYQPSDMSSEVLSPEVFDDEVLFSTTVFYRKKKHILEARTNLLTLSVEVERIPVLILQCDFVYGVKVIDDKLELVIYTLEKNQKNKCKHKSYTMGLDDSYMVAASLQNWIAGRPIAAKLSKRQMLILVNPVGGSKKALKVYKKVEKMFNLCGTIQPVRKDTQRRGHAEEIAHDLKLDEYEGIICVSGDGLPNEVINGLLCRPDWQTARQMPVGFIPAGSGNGTAFSLGITDPFTAALIIIKGHTEPLDIVCYSTPQGVVYSHLEMLYALLSDIDLGSEVLRWMGPLRITVWALIRIAFLRKYNAKLTWIPAEPNEHPVPDYTQTDPTLRYGPVRRHTGPGATRPESNWSEASGSFTLFNAMNVAWPFNDLCLAPYASHKDGTIDLVFSTTSCRAAMFKSLLNGSKAKHVGAKGISYEKCK
eukprot:Ihof_evm12s78 gene=Ihof_evmTU12s78